MIPSVLLNWFVNEGSLKQHDSDEYFKINICSIYHCLFHRFKEIPVIFIKVNRRVHSNPHLVYIVYKATLNIMLTSHENIFLIIFRCLFHRFKEVPVIFREVNRLVHSNPHLVSDDADALLFLATEDTIRGNSQELVHILTWTKCAPMTALSFFSQQYPPHHLTAQYAVRVLRSYPPVS